MEENKTFDRLINARNFHYQNFSIWMTFFTVIIGALFVGLYNIDSSKNNIPVLIILICGYISSFCFFISAKGYVYWETNWISLIHKYEEKLNDEDKIYSVFADKNYNNNVFIPFSGASFSTSKIVLFLAFCITICWGYLLSSNIFCFIGLNHIILFIISSIAFTIVLLYLTKFFLKTNMNPLKNLGLNSKNNVNFDELKKN